MLFPLNHMASPNIFLHSLKNDTLADMMEEDETGKHGGGHCIYTSPITIFNALDGLKKLFVLQCVSSFYDNGFLVWVLPHPHEACTGRAEA